MKYAQLIAGLLIGGILFGGDTITVYTPDNIYFLKGNKIVQEVGPVLKYDTRMEAVAALEDISVRDAQRPIHLRMLTIGEDCVTEIIVDRWDYERLTVEFEYMDDESYPADFLRDNGVTLLYDY